jgi:hypothetical protein
MGIRYLLVTRTNEAEYGDDFLPMGDIPYPTRIKTGTEQVFFSRLGVTRQLPDTLLPLWL